MKKAGRLQKRLPGRWFHTLIIKFCPALKSVWDPASCRNLALSSWKMANIFYLWSAPWSLSISSSCPFSSNHIIYGKYIFFRWNISLISLSNLCKAYIRNFRLLVAVVPACFFKKIRILIITCLAFCAVWYFLHKFEFKVFNFSLGPHIVLGGDSLQCRLHVWKW